MTNGKEMFKISNKNNCCHSTSACSKFNQQCVINVAHTPNIEFDTIFLTIKDALIRLQLSLTQCRGQCYDGASNMMGKRSGVAKKILECQPKAHPTHCYAHSFRLSDKDATSHCKILSDIMGNTNEVVQMIKFSPKRDTILGSLKQISTTKETNGKMLLDL